MLSVLCAAFLLATGGATVRDASRLQQRVLPQTDTDNGTAFSGNVSTCTGMWGAKILMLLADMV